MNNDDIILGRKAISYTINCISWAAQIAVFWFTPWYIGLLLTLLMAYITYLIELFAQSYISNASFESYGNKVGSALNSVRNVFSRKATA